MSCGVLLFFAGCVTFPQEPANRIPAARHDQASESTAKASTPQEKENTRVRTPATPRQLASVRLVALGKRNVELGNYNRGISQLERALALNGYDTMAYYYLALAWLWKGRPERALGFAQKAELFSQNDPEELKKVYVIESEIYRKLGRSKKAVLYKQKAKALK